MKKIIAESWFKWVFLFAIVAISMSPLKSKAEEIKARRADDFVDYMGVAATFGNDNGRWNNLVYDGLSELGIRYIRGWMNWLDDDVDRFKEMGIRMVGLWSDNKLKKPLQCRPKILDVGADFFIAIEGHNEPDVFSKKACYKEFCNDFRTNKYDATKAHQQDFYNDLKSDPLTADLPVVATALARPKKIDDASPQPHDLRNLHYYPKWKENTYPTAGYGWNNVGFEDTFSVLVDNYGTDFPIFVTESGHNSDTQVSELAQAKYIGRMFAEYFQQPNIAKFFYFRLHQKDYGKSHDSWGLMDVNGNRFQAFYGLKSLIDLLKEATYDVSASKWKVPNPDFTPGTLNITYTGKKTSTHDLLMQKADGTYYLLIWQEVNSFDANTSEDLNPELDNLTITIGEGISSASKHEYNLNNFIFEESNISVVDGNSINVSVPDSVIAIEFSNY